jgi:hypothetical protein
MPGENEILKEFVADLQPKLLVHLVGVVFEKKKPAVTRCRSRWDRATAYKPVERTSP